MPSEPPPDQIGSTSGLDETRQQRQNADMDYAQLPRLQFAERVGVSPRTVDRWISVGVDGIRLPSHYVGGRVMIFLSEYSHWQDRIREHRRGPVKKHKTSKAAHQALESNGYK